MAEVEWSVEAARSGEPTLKLARRHAHSQYNPRRESERLVNRVLQSAGDGGYDSLVLLGSGLGYVTRELIARFDGPVLLWEPFPELSRELASTVDVASTTANRATPCATTLATDPLEFDAALSRLGTRPFFWIHPGYEHVCRFEARYALRALRMRTPNRGRLQTRDAIVSERGLDAVGRLPFAPVVEDMGQCLEGQTVIIASGGPSLEPALPSLARHAGGVRFACVQRLRMFADAAAHVHFAVSVDLRNLFKVFRLDDDIPFDVLLADSSSAPNMLDLHRDRACLFHQRTSHVHQLLWQQLGLDVIDEPNISVSETAMLLAHRMGARRFILAGVDLDSVDSRYHEQFDARCQSRKLATTNSHYFHASRYLNHYCTRLRDEGCEILRLGDGLAVEGCEEIGVDAFDTVLAELPRFTAPELYRAPNAVRLKASRRLYQDLVRGSTVAGRPSPTDPGIARTDPGWKPLDPRASRQLARSELQALDLRYRNAFS